MWRSHAGARERSWGARGATRNVRERKRAREAVSSGLNTSLRERGQAVREVGHGRSAFRGATKVHRSSIVRSGWNTHTRAKAPILCQRSRPARTGRRDRVRFRGIGSVHGGATQGRSPHEDDTVERRNSTPHGATARQNQRAESRKAPCAPSELPRKGGPKEGRGT